MMTTTIMGAKLTSISMPADDSDMVGCLYPPRQKKNLFYLRIPNGLLMEALVQVILARLLDVWHRGIVGTKPSRGLPDREDTLGGVIVPHAPCTNLQKLAAVFQPPTRIFTCEFTGASLYLGSAYNAADEQNLQEHTIRHILNVSQSIPCWHVGVTYFRIPARDVAGASLFFNEAMCYETLHFIHSNLMRKRNVLIHCQFGSSRSAAVVLLYLMWRRCGGSTGIYDSIVAAYDEIVHRRPMIDINTGFLLEVENLLTAMYQHTHQLSLPPPHYPHHGHRHGIFRLARAPRKAPKAIGAAEEMDRHDQQPRHVPSFGGDDELFAPHVRVLGLRMGFKG